MRLIVWGLLWIFVICGARADGPPGPPPPHVHMDGSDWIQRGGHTNADGELCCGLNDCKEISSDGVGITGAGYFIKGLRETIPYSETKNSEDGRYWRCQWGGMRKCFFAPVPGY
jgi:hypothetical protein